jgi:hypothetical protein
MRLHAMVLHVVIIKHKDIFTFALNCRRYKPGIATACHNPEDRIFFQNAFLGL